MYKFRKIRGKPRFVGEFSRRIGAPVVTRRYLIKLDAHREEIMTVRKHLHVFGGFGVANTVPDISVMCVG